jgi:hypothetical protein
MRRRGVLFGLICFALLAAAGCGGGGGGGNPLGPTDLAGNYTLTEVKFTDSAGVTVTAVPPSVSGSLSLTSAATFTMSIAIPSEGFSDSGSGTYAVSDPNIAFRFSRGDTLNGVFRDGGNRIVITETDRGETLTFTFTKV